MTSNEWRVWNMTFGFSSSSEMVPFSSFVIEQIFQSLLMSIIVVEFVCCLLFIWLSLLYLFWTPFDLFAQCRKKRKQFVVTLKKKCLKNDKFGHVLSDQYGVGPSTISDIKKNSEFLMQYAHNLYSEDGSTYCKIMKKPKHKAIDKAVYAWFL